MILIPRRRLAVAMTIAAALYATSVSGQTTDPKASAPHDHAQATAAPENAQPAAGMHRDVMARMAALDERIRTLAADMNMFVGDMKVETMAALLTAMVERHAVMLDEMRQMRGRMMGSMMDRSMLDRAEPEAQGEAEPGGMCAPSL